MLDVNMSSALMVVIVGQIFYYDCIVSDQCLVRVCEISCYKESCATHFILNMYVAMPFSNFKQSSVHISDQFPT